MRRIDDDNWEYQAVLSAILLWSQVINSHSLANNVWNIFQFVKIMTF